MKNRIESRHNKYSTARSSSSSSSEDMGHHEDKYKSTGNKEDRHKTHYNDKKERSYKRYYRDGSDSHSNSGGYNDSSEEESTSKRSNYRNTKDNNVMIKDEPASDDERRHRNVETEDNRTNRRRFQNESKSRWRSRSRSPPVKQERLSDDDRRPMKQERFSDNDRRSVKKERFSEAEKEPRWGKQSDPSNQDKKKPLVDKAKPDFGLSGKLAEETNMYNGVVIKYSEPPEARKPKRRWRLYPFKGDEGLPTLYIHRQSAFLIGRDRKVADLPIDHPSCSKQHAVLQYRLVPFERNDGRSGKRICPYIIDLESANGTFVNNIKIEPKKYVELLEKDVIKFAFSSREYVLLHEHSKDSGDDDDM